MKQLLTFILALLFVTTAFGQRRIAVMVDTNSALINPTNFFVANSNSINNVVTGGSDNLGDHTATQALNMATFAITNVGAILAGAITNAAGDNVLFGPTAYDGSGLTNLAVTASPLNHSGGLAIREATSLQLQNPPRYVESVTLTGVTNIHGSLIWRDPASGSNYFFGTSRPLNIGGYPASLVRVPCNDLTNFTVFQFPTSAEFGTCEQLVEIDGTLYLLFATYTGLGTHMNIVTVDPLTLVTNSFVNDTDHTVSKLGTMVTDGADLYVANGLTYPGIVWKIDGSTGAYLGTNTIQPTIPSASELPGATAHSMVYDGERIYMGGNSAPSSDVYAWMGYLETDMSSFTGDNFTNSIEAFYKTTDDMAEVGEWVFMGAEAATYGRCAIGVIKKDLSEARYIVPPTSFAAAACYGTWYYPPYVYAVYAADEADGNLLRIDPVTLETDYFSVPNTDTPNELLWDGNNFYATSWSAAQDSAVVLTRFAQPTPLFETPATSTNYFTLKQPDVIGTAGTEDATSSSGTYKLITLDATSDVSTNSMLFRMPAIRDIDTNYPMTLESLTLVSSGIDFSDLYHHLTLDVISVTAGSAPKVTTDTYFYQVPVVWNNKTKAGGQVHEAVSSPTTLTNWAAYVQGVPHIIRIGRDGDDAGDTSAKTSTIYGVVFGYRVKP